MTLATLLLAAAVVPAAASKPPSGTAHKAAHKAPKAAKPAPAPAAEEASAQAPAAEPVGSPESHIEAGLRDFRRHRFARAQAQFEQALAADPQSAAATFYLAYTVYKIAEPKRPFHPDKQKAAELFAKAYSLDPNFKPVWHQ
jgi:Tfp pilus assembly protein PilF